MNLPPMPAPTRTLYGPNRTIDGHYFTAQQMSAYAQATARALVNTPETADFIEGVKREAAHQIERWGYAHDRSKSAENWFWLVGYLAGKALRSAITGDREKALHHCISSAAALFNWHTATKHDTTGAGIGQDDDLRAKNPIDAQAADDAGLVPFEPYVRAHWKERGEG